jgi:flagellar basal-body rod protein FlgF
MTDTIDVIGASMHADAETLRMIAQNVANAQSVAYMRQIPLTHATFDAAASHADSDNTGVGFAGHARLPASTLVALDMRPGTLRSTAAPMDLAIEGKGFFVVQTGGGEVLTRRGDFKLDSEGRLVTQAGDPVLGTSGPVQIGTGQPSIAADGTVRVGADVVGNLRIEQVDSATALQPAGDGCYTMTGDQSSTPMDAPIVRQGYLESSNVQTVNEMVQMMETMRRFEASQHFARGYDDMVEKALGTLGRV